MVIRRKRISQWDDGDSGKFTDGKRFRLKDVRAHEKHQFGGPRATKTAAGMIGRTRGFVNVKKVAIDKYGRDLVEMWNKDGSINKRMIKRGYGNKGR